MGRFSAIVLLAFASLAAAQWDPHFVENRTSIVHLFEWRWEDIALECERFLGPYGYAGVQTSPASEHIFVRGDKNRPWYERYQTVSYKLINRSGNEEQFQDMVRRCNAVGVRIYADVVFNHMTASGVSQGTGGTDYDSTNKNYPGVPYSAFDFNGPQNCYTGSGEIENYNDPEQVRNCKLVGMNDLNHGTEYVRGKIRDYLNKMIGYGVAGFRVDACKHMWPGDLKAIFDGLNDLNTDYGFPPGSRPFIVQEVIDMGFEAIKSSEYFASGRVTEFKGCQNIGNIMRKWEGQKLSFVKNWGEGWGFMPDGNALVFVDNHDNQRGEGAGGPSILSFFDARIYKMAQAFFLAWPYGITRVMSSYFWERKIEGGHDQNYWVGPPMDGSENIIPVSINPDMTCNDGWMCEHRWRQIYNMVGFRNVASGTAMNDWWDNGSNQIAFSRGDKAFLAINNDDFPMSATIQTGLPGGQYCDLISGNLVNGACTGKTITVNADRTINVDITNAQEDPFIAIHVNAKL